MIVVRPRRDGKWEVVKVTEAQNEHWRKRWDAWYAKFGQKLAASNPQFWRTH